MPSAAENHEINKIGSLPIVNKYNDFNNSNNRHMQKCLFKGVCPKFEY